MHLLLGKIFKQKLPGNSLYDGAPEANGRMSFSRRVNSHIAVIDLVREINSIHRTDLGSNQGHSDASPAHDD